MPRTCLTAMKDQTASIRRPCGKLFIEDIAGQLSAFCAFTIRNPQIPVFPGVCRIGMVGYPPIVRRKPGTSIRILSKGKLLQLPAVALNYPYMSVALKGYQPAVSGKTWVTIPLVRPCKPFDPAGHKLPAPGCRRISFYRGISNVQRQAEEGDEDYFCNQAIRSIRQRSVRHRLLCSAR